MVRERLCIKRLSYKRDNKIEHYQSFEQVQARLTAHKTKVTPPRVANGSSLLVGLATCASFGAGMTRMGTVKRGKASSYFSIGGYHSKGKTVCKGRHVPTAKLDQAVT